MDIAGMIRGLKEIILSLREQRRIRILKHHGMHIGKNVTIMPGVDFDFPYSHLIYIGDNCSISKDVRIMAHDATVNKYLGYTMVAPVIIKDNCFIGEKAIILPGVEIGPDAIIAAGSVVNKIIPAGKVAAGNPARVYTTIEEFLSKACANISKGIIYEKSTFFDEAYFDKVKKDIREHKRIIIRNIKDNSLNYGGTPQLINGSFYRNIRRDLEKGLSRSERTKTNCNKTQNLLSH